MSEGPYRVVPSDKNGWWVVGSPVGRLGWFDEETDAHKAVRIANTAHAAALASSKPSPASDLQDAHRKGIADGISSVASDLEGGLPWAVEWNHEGRTMVLAIEADGSFDFTEFKGGEVVHMHTWKPKPSDAFVAMRTAIQYIMDGVAYTQKSMPGGRDVLLAASSVQVNSDVLIKARAALALAEKEVGTTPPTT